MRGNFKNNVGNSLITEGLLPGDEPYNEAGIEQTKKWLHAMAEENSRGPRAARALLNLLEGKIKKIPDEYMTPGHEQFDCVMRSLLAENVDGSHRVKTHVKIAMEQMDFKSLVEHQEKTFVPADIRKRAEMAQKVFGHDKPSPLQEG